MRVRKVEASGTKGVGWGTGGRGSEEWRLRTHCLWRERFREGRERASLEVVGRVIIVLRLRRDTGETRVGQALIRSSLLRNGVVLVWKRSGMR